METLPDAEWPSLTEVTFQATERLDPLEGILLEATTRDEAQSDNRAKEVNDLIRRAGEEKAHGDALIGTHPPTQGEWEKTQPSYKRADELWTAALALREKADKSRPGRHADYITGLVTALRNGHAYARALLAQHVVLLLRSPRWTVEGTRPGLAIREVILKDWLENPFTVEFAQGVSVEYAGVAYCGVIVRRPTGAETGEASPGGNAPPEPNDEVPPVELATLSKRLGGRPPNPARDRIVASYFERRDAGYQPPDPNVRGSMAKEIDAILEGIGCMNVDAKETTVRTSVIARGDRTSRPLPLSGRERGSETCRRPAVDEHRLIAEAISLHDDRRARHRGSVSAYWRVAGAYWKGPTSVQAWSLTLISLVLVVGNVVVQYGINLWNRSFFNALQQRDQSFVYQAIAIFLALAFAAAVVAVLQLVFGGPTEAMSVKKTAAAALSQRPNATAPTRRSK